MMFSLIVRSISRASSSKCISSSAKPVILGSAWISTKSSVENIISDDKNNNNNDSGMTLPWLMLPRAIDTSRNGEKAYTFYSPVENKVITKSALQNRVSDDDVDVGLLGCSHGWLVMHNKRSHDLFLYDPVSARRIELPSIGSVPDKVIISSDMAMAMMCVKGTLAFCVPGRTALWTDLILNETTRYKDFVYSSKHKLLFCETRGFGRKIESWDVSNTRSPRIVRQTSLEEGGYYPDENVWETNLEEYYNNPDECNTVRYLVPAEQSSELFLVKRHMTQHQQEGTSTIGFDVFVIDVVCGKMRYVDGSLNGISLFVGAKNDNCFALLAAPESLFRPDSIYFTDKKHSSDIGIYNYQSGTVSYYPSIKNSTTALMPAVWFTPTLCTPPAVSNSSKTCTAAGTAMSNSSKKRTTPQMFLTPFKRNNYHNFPSRLLDNKVVTEKSFIPAECGAYVRFLDCLHGWLALQNTCSYELYLSNPFSRHHIKLPSIFRVEKLVISGSPDDEEEELRAMVTFHEPFSDIMFELAFCVPGSSTEWTRLPCPCEKTKQDFHMDHVYSSRHKLFFCVSFFGRVESWDLTDTASPRIEWSADLEDKGLRRYSRIIKSEQGLCSYNHKYLVFDDHSNQLFLIIQHIREHVNKAAGFDVYKIDDWEGGGRGRLIHMDGSLNGLSLFIGDNNGFALSAAEFPGLKPDSIYYSTGIYDFGIFNYQDGTFSPNSEFQFGPFDPTLVYSTIPS